MAELEEQMGSILLCKDSMEWLLPLPFSPRWPLCWEYAPPATPFGGAPDLVTDDVNVELALGKDGALAPDLGKVLEAFPPDDLLTTWGGPGGGSRPGFRC